MSYCNLCNGQCNVIGHAAARPVETRPPAPRYQCRDCNEILEGDDARRKHNHGELLTRFIELEISEPAEQAAPPRPLDAFPRTKQEWRRYKRLQKRAILAQMPYREAEEWADGMVTVQQLQRTDGNGQLKIPHWQIDFCGIRFGGRVDKAPVDTLADDLRRHLRKKLRHYAAQEKRAMLCSLGFDQKRGYLKAPAPAAIEQARPQQIVGISHDQSKMFGAAAAEPAPERTPPSLPDYLEDDAPFQRCDTCARKTWDRNEWDKLCTMIQFDNQQCGGRFHPESELRRIYNAAEWPEADKWCRENKWPIGLPVYHPGGQGYQYLPAILTAYDLRARAVAVPEPAQKFYCHCCGKLATCAECEKKHAEPAAQPKVMRIMSNNQGIHIEHEEICAREKCEHVADYGAFAERGDK